MEYIILTLILSISAVFAYGSSHVAEEQRRGEYIPFFWEKKTNKVFDKSDIEYTDGDNT